MTNDTLSAYDTFTGDDAERLRELLLRFVASKYVEYEQCRPILDVCAELASCTPMTTTTTAMVPHATPLPIPMSVDDTPASIGDELAAIVARYATPERQCYRFDFATILPLKRASSVANMSLYKLAKTLRATFTSVSATTATVDVFQQSSGYRSIMRLEEFQRRRNIYRFLEALSPDAIEDVIAERARPRAIHSFVHLGNAFFRILTEYECNVFRRAYVVHVRAQASNNDA